MVKIVEKVVQLDNEKKKKKNIQFIHFLHSFSSSNQYTLYSVKIHGKTM